MRIFLTIVTLLTINSCGSDATCANEVIEEVHSPDRKLKVVIFSRDCGATTGTSTQLSVLQADTELKNEGGNTFAIDKGKASARGQEIEIEWNTNKRLTVYFDSLARTFEMKDKIEGIEIYYRNF
jgi:hypothetical protein